MCGCGAGMSVLYEVQFLSAITPFGYSIIVFVYGGHFYNAITAPGMLWIPYDFYAVPYAAQLLKKKAQPCGDTVKIFYGAAFQMSLKTHFRHKKKTRKKRERRQVGLEGCCHFLVELELESVWLFISRRGSASARIRLLTAKKPSDWCFSWRYQDGIVNISLKTRFSDGDNARASSKV